MAEQKMQLLHKLINWNWNTKNVKNINMFIMKEIDMSLVLKSMVRGYDLALLIPKKKLQK